MKWFGRRFAVLLVLVLWGCAAFVEKQPPRVDQWPPKQSHKKTISLVLTDRYLHNGQEGGVIVLGRSVWLDHAMKVYIDSGLFSQVQSGRETPADIVAEIRATQNIEDSIGRSILSGLTLTLFPNRTGTTVTVKTTFKDGKTGDVLGTFEKEESLNTYVGLLMIFPMPFAWPWSVGYTAYEDLHKATISEAVEKGYL